MCHATSDNRTTSNFAMQSHFPQVENPERKLSAQPASIARGRTGIVEHA